MWIGVKWPIPWNSSSAWMFQWICQGRFTDSKWECREYSTEYHGSLLFDIIDLLAICYSPLSKPCSIYLDDLPIEHCYVMFQNYVNYQRLCERDFKHTDNSWWFNSWWFQIWLSTWNLYFKMVEVENFLRIWNCMRAPFFLCNTSH